ncbi:MAG: hypothetical protein ACI4I1_11105 [Oscillospiraceae bacterium]
MISYIFSENEIKLLCRLLNAEVLSKHQFDNDPFDDEKYASSIASLSGKGFVNLSSNGITVNSGIAMMINRMSRACKLFLGNCKRKFTAYIEDHISILLIDDLYSKKIMLCPFEREDELSEWLNENGFFIWETVYLNGGDDNG